MSRTDHHRLQFFSHQLQRVCHMRLFKRAENVVKIIFCRSHIPFVIGNRTPENSVMSIVGTEGIAGHENAVLLDIGVDRIRPVKTRH